MTTINTSAAVALASALALNAYGIPVKAPQAATPLADALQRILPDEHVRAGFIAWLKANTSQGNTCFIMDAGTTIDRCLFANNLAMSITAERDLRTGAGFTYVDAAGKTHQTNLEKLGILFTRHSSIEKGVYAYATLTRETSGHTRYDRLFNRGQASQATTPAAVATPLANAGKDNKTPDKAKK